jgi:hypothetical protein
LKHSFNKNIAAKYGIPEAILFENISYWCEKNEANKNNIHDNNSWTYNTYEAFEELFPYLKPNTIKKALRALKEAGLIDIRNDLSVNKWDKTNWYSIVNFSNYREAKKSTLDSQKKAPSNNNKKNDHIKEHLLNTNKNTDSKQTKINVEDHFENIWKFYIKKEGKGQISSSKKKTFIKYSVAEWETIIKRYSEKVKGWEKKFIMHGSTFFNGGYVDYLDENYQEQIKQQQNEEEFVCEVFK